MPDLTTIGRFVFLAGVIVMIVGAGLWLAGRFGLPLGRLPGDIRIENGNTTFYFPLATSILLSLGLTLLLNLLGRLFNR